MSDTKWKNFTQKELLCRCGNPNCTSTINSIDAEMMDEVQDIRERLGIGMPITSGHRCKLHNSERKKAKPGTGAHPRGKAVDIGCGSYNAHLLAQMAFAAPYIKLIEELKALVDREVEDNPELQDSFYTILDEAGWVDGYLPPIFTGVGVSQNKRGPRFLHLDTAEEHEIPRPRIWSY